MKKILLKSLKVGFILCFNIAILAGVDAALGFWQQNFADSLQRARRIMHADEALGWKLDRNLNTKFEKKTFFTNAEGLRVGSPQPTNSDFNSSPDILVLGPSSALGWGVEFNETWSQLLEQDLNQWNSNKIDHLKNEKPLSILNASQIGYSLFQGWRLFKQLKSSPSVFKNLKLVILAFGVNDVDRFRFYNSDGQPDLIHFRNLQENESPAIAEPRAGVQITEPFFKSSILMLLQRGFEEFSWSLGCRPPQTFEIRVNAKDFVLLLEQWRKELNEIGVGLLVVNSATNIPVVIDLEKAKLSDRLELESANAAREDQCAKARELYKQSREFEPWRVLRDIKALNEAIKAWADEHQVPLADIDSDINLRSDKSKLFVDPIHFSPEGNHLVENIVAKSYQAMRLIHERK